MGQDREGLGVAAQDAAALPGDAPSPSVSAPAGAAAANASCEDCRFGKVIYRKGDAYTYYSESSYEDKRGERSSTHIVCRRRPPIMVPEWGWSQPSVCPDDWCGEFEVARTESPHG